MLKQVLRTQLASSAFIKASRQATVVQRRFASTSTEAPKHDGAPKQDAPKHDGPKTQGLHSKGGSNTLYGALLVAGLAGGAYFAYESGLFHTGAGHPVQPHEGSQLHGEKKGKESDVRPTKTHVEVTHDKFADAVQEAKAELKTGAPADAKKGNH